MLTECQKSSGLTKDSTLSGCYSPRIALSDLAVTETAVRAKNKEHTICLNNKKVRTLAREGQRFLCPGAKEGMKSI